MPTNMGRMPFQAVTNTLVGGAGVAAVADLDVSNIRVMTATLAVSVAALTGLEVWVRGDPDAAYFQLPTAAYLSYGRTDAATDVTTTPVGASCFVQVDVTGWRSVQVRAKSAGAAKITVTAGGQP